MSAMMSGDKSVFEVFDMESIMLGVIKRRDEKHYALVCLSRDFKGEVSSFQLGKFASAEEAEPLSVGTDLVEKARRSRTR